MEFQPREQRVGDDQLRMRGRWDSNCVCRIQPGHPNGVVENIGLVRQNCSAHLVQTVCSVAVICGCSVYPEHVMPRR